MFAQRRQAGIALILFVVLLLAGVTVFGLTVKEVPKPDSMLREAETLHLLMEAKQQLIGSIYKENKRPGELRRFDKNGDGSGDSDTPFGHFPWRQLHHSRFSHSFVGDNNARESLWYFAHPFFRTDSSEELNYDVDHTGYSIDGKNGYAAVLIAAGEPLNAAQGAGRPSSDVADISAYLEDLNALGGSAFVTARKATEPTNDLVVGIEIQQLITLAADFAARKFVGRLLEYESDSTEGCTYPAPAAFSPDMAKASASHNLLVSQASPTLIVGMPAVSETGGVLPKEWEECGAKLSASNTDSFLAQKWFRFMRYARAPGGDGGVGCTPGSDCLVVQDGSGTVLHDDVEALVIFSGYPLSGVVWSNPLTLNKFFEGENLDDDAVFQLSPADDTFNDVLYIVRHSGA